MHARTTHTRTHTHTCLHAWRHWHKGHQTNCTQQVGAQNLVGKEFGEKVLKVLGRDALVAEPEHVLFEKVVHGLLSDLEQASREASRQTKAIVTAAAEDW